MTTVSNSTPQVDVHAEKHNTTDARIDSHESRLDGHDTRLHDLEAVAPKTGAKGEKGDPGPAGATGQRGQVGPAGPAGRDGMPPPVGGAVGDVLTKTETGAEWSSGGPGGPGGGGLGGGFHGTVTAYDADAMTATITHGTTTYTACANQSNVVLQADDVVYAVVDVDVAGSAIVFGLRSRGGVLNPAVSGGKQAVTGLQYPLVTFHSYTASVATPLRSSPNSKWLVWSGGGVTYRLCNDQNVRETGASTMIDSTGERTWIDNTGYIAYCNGTGTAFVTPLGAAAGTQVRVRDKAAAVSNLTGMKASWVDADGTVWFAGGGKSNGAGGYYRLAVLSKTDTTYIADVRDNDHGLWEALGWTPAEALATASVGSIGGAVATATHVVLVATHKTAGYALVARPLDGSANWAVIQTGVSSDIYNYGLGRFSTNGPVVEYGTARTAMDGSTSVNLVGYTEIDLAGTATAKADLTPGTVAAYAEKTDNAASLASGVFCRAARISATRHAIATVVTEDQDGGSGAVAGAPKVTVWIVDDLGGGSIVRQRAWTSPPMRLTSWDGSAPHGQMAIKGVHAEPTGGGNANVYVSVYYSNTGSVSGQLDRASVLYMVQVPA